MGGIAADDNRLSDEGRSLSDGRPGSRKGERAGRFTHPIPLKNCPTPTYFERPNPRFPPRRHRAYIGEIEVVVQMTMKTITGGLAGAALTLTTVAAGSVDELSNHNPQLPGRSLGRPRALPHARVTTAIVLLEI